MNTPLRSLAGASLALWLGAVLMTGAAAAIAFPAMRDLAPALAQFPAHPEDHWSITAGHVMLPVFRVLDFATLALSSVAVVCTGLSVRACTGRVAIALWLVGLVGAGGIGVHHALDRSPHMDALATAWWDAASDGDEATAQAKKQAFDDLHPVASAALKAESALLLLAIGGWAFAPLRVCTTEESPS